MRPTLLAAALLAAGCGTPPPSTVTIDSIAYTDPTCAPSSTPPPNCIGLVPGPQSFRKGWRHAQLDHLREQASSVQLLVHSDGPNLGQVQHWFLVTNEQRHEATVAMASAKGGKSDVALTVDTAWLDDRVAAIDLDPDCEVWCQEQPSDDATIDEIDLQGWSQDDQGLVHLLATAHFSTLDRRGAETMSPADGTCSHACEPCPYGSSYFSYCTCYFCSTYCALYNSNGQYVGTFVTGSCC